MFTHCRCWRKLPSHLEDCPVLELALSLVRSCFDDVETAVEAVLDAAAPFTADDWPIAVLDEAAPFTETFGVCSAAEAVTTTGLIWGPLEPHKTT